MRVYPHAVAAHLAAHAPLLVHALLWITVRDRDTQAPESIGLWTGADHETITVDGAPRSYYGAGAMLGLEDFVSRAALEVREWSAQISPLHDQVVEAVRLYDARLAPIDLHLWYIDPATMQPLAAPVREFRGTCTGLDLHMPEEGGSATCTIRAASDAWRLTRGLTLKRSAAALLARNPGDNLRRYNAISGSVPAAWGEKMAPPDPGGASPPVWRSR